MKITDFRAAAAEDFNSMQPRSTIRRVSSLLLMLVIACWAQAGLALPQADPHGMLCHKPTSHAVQPAVVPELPPSLHPCHHEHANPQPCCPEHSQPAPVRPAERPCCVLSKTSLESVAFVVVSITRLSKQAATSQTAFLPPAQPLRASAPDPAQAPVPIQAVLDKKTDLRI